MTDSASAPAPSEDTTGRLILHVREKDGVFGVPSNVQPYARINDSEITIGWGLNDVPIAAGPGRLEVGLRRGKVDYGEADTQISMTAGQRLELHYSPPMWRFQKGRISSTPQPFPGKYSLGFVVAFFVLLAIASLIVLLVLILS